MPPRVESSPVDVQQFKLGASCLADGGVQFVAWAPFATKVKVHLLAPVDRLVQMERLPGHYFRAVVAKLPEGRLYRYRLYGARAAGREYSDPVSRSQPEGVHGPSAVVDEAFAWTDSAWRGAELRDFVVYELHVGAFTPEGTFDAAIARLDALVELGVNAIEIMPVAQCPGERNWGYDGVYPFAVQHSYGGAKALKRLVDACHRRGLSAVLDVVYNHLGPEGNYIAQYGPYFTDRYRTPWGEALNFDGRSSDDVRRYFIDNALAVDRRVSLRCPAARRRACDLRCLGPPLSAGARRRRACPRARTRPAGVSHRRDESQSSGLGSASRRRWAGARRAVGR